MIPLPALPLEPPRIAAIVIVVGLFSSTAPDTNVLPVPYLRFGAFRPRLV